MRFPRSSSVLLPALIAVLTGVLGLWLLGLWPLGNPDRVDWDEIAYENAAEIDRGEPLQSPDWRPELGPGGESMPLREEPADLRTEMAGRRVARRPVSAPTRETDREKGFQVRVVRAEDQAAVAGADVFFFDTLSPQYAQFRKQLSRYRRDKELGLEIAGERVQTDAYGFATLPHGIPAQAIVARKDDRYGELSVLGASAIPETGYVLQLRPDHTLRVRVVDERGLGVTDVGLAFYTPRPGGGQGWVRRKLVPAEVTAEGVRRFTHIQELASKLLEDDPAGPQLRIELNVPGLIGRGATVSLLELPRKPVELVLPATGRVRVRVTDDDGEPFPRTVQLTQPPDPRRELPLPDWSARTDARGEVLFPRVGLGQDYVAASVGPGVGPDERVRFEGPIAGDALVRVELKRRFTAARIVGVALDRDDQPIADGAIRFAAEVERPAPATASLLTGSVPTDAQGRFVIRLPPTAIKIGEKGETVETNRYRALRLAHGGDPRRSGTRVPVLPRLHASRYDVGAVRLRQPKLIASGQVWIDGKPARGFDRFVLDTRNPERKNRWERVQDLVVVAGPEGRFEIRGDLGERAVRLRVRSWGYFPLPPVSLRQGMQGIEFRLVSGGSVRAALLFDPIVEEVPVEVRLVPTRLATHRLTPALRSLCLGRVDKRGTGNPRYRRAYWWAGLPEGVYQLEVRLLGAPRPCRVIEGIEPVRGRRMDSLWAFEVSLLGAIERTELRVRDKRGRGLSALVVSTGQGGAEAREAVPVVRGRAVLYHHVEAGRPDLLIAARGYAPALLRGVGGSRTVILHPGAQVSIALQTPELPPGVALRVSLRRRRDSAPLVRVGLRHPIRPGAGARSVAALLKETAIRLGRKGKMWRGTVGQPGEFDIRIEVLGRGGKPRSRIVEIRPGRLRIDSARGARRVDVTVPAAAWADALGRIGVDPVDARRRPAQKR